MFWPAHEIERLRKNRIRPAPELSIAAAVSSTADSARRVHKKLGSLIALWEELVPAQLADRCSLNGPRAGVLHVEVDSSPVAFELDRLLRSGLEEQLRRRYRGTLMRVKVHFGDVARKAGSTRDGSRPTPRRRRRMR